MYYDFYCNERMLLDHYADYDNGNRALKRLICQTGMPPDKCADMYFAKMDNHLGLAYDRYDTVKWFDERRTEKNVLRALDKIPVYKQDLDFMQEQIRHRKLTLHEQLCLFGVIMMCRINNTDTVDLTTRFKIRQFCSCFDRKLWDVVYNKDTWYEAYHAPIGMRAVSDTYDLLLRTDSAHKAGQIGCYYTYGNYELRNKETVYEQVVTPSTNRLDLYRVFCEVGLEDIRFCVSCGRIFYAGNTRAMYCGNCLTDIKKKQTRERVRRYRAKKKRCNATE